MLPLIWLASGCGGGAEPPKEAATPTKPAVEKGEPAEKEAPAESPEPTAAVEGWGSVKGRIVYVGDAPEQPRIEVPANIEYCKDHEIVDESLIVNAENKGIKNVFIYVRSEKRIAPELKDAPAEKAVIDQKFCHFIPHAQVIRVEQGLEVLSDDPIRHNTHTVPSPRNPLFNEAIEANLREGRNVPLKRPENVPFQVKCDIHPWMSAWVLPLDHPYGVVTDENGNFELKDLPAGKVSLIIWHEKKPSDFIDKAKEVTIVAGETSDLGEIEVPADTL
jgi:hypothetical protein